MLNFLIEFSPAILSITLLEIILSVDNSLVNATLAESLLPKDKTRAILYGTFLGAIFRVVALIFASYIIHNKIILGIGAIYLIWLAWDHLYKEHDTEKNFHPQHKNFWKIVLQISVASLIFSIDNIVGAIGLSQNIYVVIFGVLIGIISLFFVTELMSVIIHKHPILKKSAYVIVGMIGVMLLLENFVGIEIGEVEKFLMIVAVIVSSLFIEHRNTPTPGGRGVV